GSRADWGPAGSRSGRAARAAARQLGAVRLGPDAGGAAPCVPTGVCGRASRRERSRLERRPAAGGPYRPGPRRLPPPRAARATGRPLGPAEMQGAIAWAIEGTPGPGAATVEEAWDHLRVDRTLHTTVHVRPEAGAPDGEDLAALLGLPTTVAALSIDASG